MGSLCPTETRWAVISTGDGLTVGRILRVTKRRVRYERVFEHIAMHAAVRGVFPSQELALKARRAATEETNGFDAQRAIDASPGYLGRLFPDALRAAASQAEGV